MWKECVIDAMMGCKDGMFTFCPIEGNINGEFTVITGMNYVGQQPPGHLKLVAIVHSHGQAAVEAFLESYRAELDMLNWSFQ